MPVALSVGWSASEWSAAGQVLLGIGAVIGGVWGVYTYDRAQRDSAAQWLHSFFLTFYTDRDMFAARKALIFDYPGLAYILEIRVTDRDVDLTPTELKQLRLVDLLLNFLEEILFLRSASHLPTSDHGFFFEYWLSLLRKPEYAALRRYAARGGYEHVASWCKAGTDEYVGKAGEDEYVALSTRACTQSILSRCDDVELVRGCQVRAMPTGDTGAFAEDPDTTTDAHLLRLKNGRSFRSLDATMGFAAAARSINLTRRRCVHLADPAVDAWIYLQAE